MGGFVGAEPDPGRSVEGGGYISGEGDPGPWVGPWRECDLHRPG